MSSLKAAKADNFYHPPDWDPGKQSLNQYQGQHPLRERARKLDQGILIIRFEMPFNIWCEKCKSHIGKGVRYNAEKKCVGKYFSTKIWEFGMRCHLCSNRIVVTTDPKNTEYVITSGGRRKVETWDPAENGQPVFMDDQDKLRLDNDPLFRLENVEKDKTVRIEQAPVLTRLEDLQERMKDDYEMSKLMRKSMRAKRQEVKQNAVDAAAKGLKLELLSASADDAAAAQQVEFAPSKGHERSQQVSRLRMDASVFGDAYGGTSASVAQRVQLAAKAVRQGLPANTLSLPGPAVARAPSFAQPGPAVARAPSAGSAPAGVAVVVVKKKARDPEREQRKLERRKRKEQRAGGDKEQRGTTSSDGGSGADSGGGGDGGGGGATSPNGEVHGLRKESDDDARKRSRLDGLVEGVSNED